MENSKIYKESIRLLLHETDNIFFEIRSLRRDNQKATMENDKKITELEKKLLDTEATMEETLAKSGEKIIKLKCGWAHFLIMPDKFVFKDGAIEEIEIMHPAEAEKYIKISKSLKLSSLKRDIISGDFSMESYTAEQQPKKFEYKYTGE